MNPTSSSPDDKLTNFVTESSKAFPSSISVAEPSETLQSPSLVTVAEGVVHMLAELGVKSAFGVSGGAIGPIWATLEQSPIEVLHFRHEGGACFAAAESYFANGRPVVAFATTGPGITNALTGLFAAKWDGAKLIFLSGATTAGKRGRWACQETSSYTMPSEGIFTPGKLFDFATTLESADQLPLITRRLAMGLGQPGGFVAHLNLPTAVQMGLLNTSLPKVNLGVRVIESDKYTQCMLG